LLIADAATKGLIPYYQKLLSRQTPDNIAIISDYILSMNEEINPSISYRAKNVFSVNLLTRTETRALEK
jgi:hypothetical protein